MTGSRRGWFDPVLVDAIDAVAADERRLDRLAQAFARVLDERSPYTRRHSERVARIATAIGAGLGFGGPALRELRRAGLLHDVGKLAVPNAVLDKPGRLSAGERRLMEGHPRHGEGLLARLPGLSTVAAVAGAHHERLDGGGYPRGRSGDELTPAMRVLAVADVFEALTANRPYRAAMPLEQALAILHDDDGLCQDCIAALERQLDSRRERRQEGGGYRSSARSSAVASRRHQMSTPASSAI